ncbi:MAG: LacI family DNA-binding transcriptional regulator [Candidatus Dormibacteria bacterium]
MARQAVRLADVARAAAVSISTASRSLNGDSRISTKTRERVERVAARLGYRPDFVARGLTLGRTFAIGLIVGDLGNPFYADLARGVEEALEPAGYVYLLANSDGRRERQLELAQRLLDRRVDGLLLTVPYHADALALTHVPRVAFDRVDTKIPYVSVDNVMGGRMAVEHLLSQGYGKIGILFGQGNEPPVRDRIMGYREALLEGGIGVDRKLEMRCADLGYAAAHAGALKLLAAGVDAIFAIDDVMAAAALAAGHEFGRRVPRDLGVVGYDDTAMAAWPSLSLTSVNQSTVTQGREAGHLMLRLVENPRARVESIVIPAHLSVRASSARSRSRTPNP